MWNKTRLSSPWKESRVAAQTPQGPAGSSLLGLLPSECFVFFMLQAMAPWCPGELLEGLCVGWGHQRRPAGWWGC